MIMCVTSRKLLQMTKDNKSWIAQHKNNPEMGKTRNSIKPHSPVVPFTRELVVNVDSEMLIKSGWQCQNSTMTQVHAVFWPARPLIIFVRKVTAKASKWLKNQKKKKVLLPRTIRKKNGRKCRMIKVFFFTKTEREKKNDLIYRDRKQTNKNRDCIRYSVYRRNNWPSLSFTFLHFPFFSLSFDHDEINNNV